MMRTLTPQQVSVFLNAFGEPLTLTSGSTITVIFESQTYGIDTDAGVVETEEYYFTTKSGSATYSDTFLFKEETQTIYNITDDLSGISNYYFRNQS